MLLLVSLVMAVWANWYRFPGTFYRDSHGFPHGTGVLEHYYPTGQLMLMERYHDGVTTEATWYRPDGMVIAVSQFNKKSGGVGYYLNNDGSIRARVRYEYRPSERAFLAHGEVTIYAPDGTVRGVEQYVDGQPAIGWEAFGKKYK